MADELAEIEKRHAAGMTHKTDMAGVTAHHDRATLLRYIRERLSAPKLTAEMRAGILADVVANKCERDEPPGSARWCWSDLSRCPCAQAAQAIIDRLSLTAAPRGESE